MNENTEKEPLVVKEARCNMNSATNTIAAGIIAEASRENNKNGDVDVDLQHWLDIELDLYQQCLKEAVYRGANVDFK